MVSRLCFGGFLLCAVLAGQDGASVPEYPVAHPECVRFGPQYKRYVANAHQAAVTAMTSLVASLLPPASGSLTANAQTPAQAGGSGIDSYIFAALNAAGVTPAPATTDYEFIRRVTLDLTGRIPTPARVLSFVADSTPSKRADLIEELLAKPEWIDKWTMFLGDLYQNNSQNSQIRRYPDGVKAFNDYVRAALQAGKPYDQMARDLITATGNNSYQDGALNFVVGGVVTGGPIQDIFDQQTANTFDVFLGLSHVNCLLCHNGRGHLDALSLWGSQTTRYQAWQLASYLSHTDITRTAVAGAVNNQPYYWNVVENTARAHIDYPLNTTTGNRPARQPVGSEKNVAPVYIFNGDTPKPGDNYRASLASEITGDFQFARATVNRFWAYFFGVGLVDPPDQFDPARQDPDNPPPAPWTLQASNPRLLNALAQSFIDNKYDLKWLMRSIANSQAYQLSSRYNGTYNSAWDTLYARHFVRRLWSEEVHDAVAQSSNILPKYAVPLNGTLTWAMEFPEPLNTPTPRDPVLPLLDAFLRGNRDDQVRSGEGSISQALDLMNDPFVMSRTKSTGAATSLLVANLSVPNDQLVNTLFLSVLSRYPTSDEMTQAVKHLTSGNRNQQAENLLWSLYNKVDFVFNY
ncbi:MAG: DUF1549 and DUF1553 domain-containing protein [Acidobacteriia bacterium]|nr:DUF1549 and DUF1553 domain-containing protein [Terriglobia bacterium]